ncbi:hypothetical protein A1O3_08873 [Capronia epimyces CBS 606.96]|uniref:Uncharacterized protein n=1 Tax=Capronia epimyces CBS 606.96 TaxID=1182542 RepID=W9XQZ3_9EURO|nr:uncharacterized protein A1O3_08873 [Capronia epimyces CBS 606.96]EXJ79371.1 hypothetical protein A1O3_08873 [Capronia epimyces CBS 606.96]
MPLATIHLISLTASSSIASFIDSLRSTGLQTLVVSKVVRWIITPSKNDVHALLSPPKPWDLLVILLGADTAALPASVAAQVEGHWTVTTGIPSRLTSDFARTNAAILHPDAASVPPLTGALDQPRFGDTAQTLELSRELAGWIRGFAATRAGKSPLSMLNLLAFRPGLKPSYLRYGKAFAESIGRRRGGVAKLVGNVVATAHTSQPDQKSDQKSGTAGAGAAWDEFALASYPSILHFADMLASHDYQAVNLGYRVPALEDTFILCTSEIEVEDLLAGKQHPGGGGGTAKL